ncbi:transforming growth factor-beta-induced protein ig-h3-like [Lineus longissimus]|uniref:transforming growth factor-beta-induced protein ig-h3-like n=1 Tax=Lineus longissimus TaxID=88925 RepID=UPI002B4D8B3B
MARNKVVMLSFVFVMVTFPVFHLDVCLADNASRTVSSDSGSLPWTLLKAALFRSPPDRDGTLRFKRIHRDQDFNWKMNNLMGVAKSLGLNSLLELLSRGNLTNLMTGKGNYTLFAPSEAAFSKLPPRLRDVISSDDAFCRQLMLYHMVEKRVSSDVFGNDILFKSLANETFIELDWTEWYKVRVNAYRNDDDNEVMTASGAAIKQTNRLASNGIIHVIDHVMFPFPNITIVERIQIDDDLSIFEYLLWNSTTEAEINALGSYTVFAPTNKAFAEIPEKEYGHLVNDTKLLKKVMERHVIITSIYTASFYENKHLTALDGSELVVVQGPGGTDIYGHGVYGHMLERDLTSSDGVLHKIDSLLWDWRGTLQQGEH